LDARRKALLDELNELGGIPVPVAKRARQVVEGGRASPRVTHRNPETGEEWRGRGRLSRWLQEKKDAGEDIEVYRVKE
jgi:DNA-binding protein H-NS